MLSQATIQHIEIHGSRQDIVAQISSRKTKHRCMAAVFCCFEVPFLKRTVKAIPYWIVFSFVFLCVCVPLLNLPSSDE